MQLAPQSQAVVLLTVTFGKSDQTGDKPLTAGEWARFAAWLRDHQLEPADLLKGDIHAQLSDWADRSVTAERIQSLLDRGTALGLALERWQRAGLWILTRSDPEYPERLKRRLRGESPAVLFGCGRKALLNSGGLAVVGSRNASEADLAATACLGKETAQQGFSVVSGGARGVDQRAMLSALECEGTAVGVLADSLLRSAVSSRYRKHVMSGNLALVTPFNPEAGFSVGRAMARNRHIYCMADAAVVINSTADKGGTWNGAMENLKNGWVPLLIRQGTAGSSGNSQLVERGAKWLPEGKPALSELFASPTAASKPRRITPHPAKGSSNEDEKPPPAQKTGVPSTISGPEPNGAPSGQRPESMRFYELFLLRLADLLADGSMKPEEIASRMELKKVQTDFWLQQAVSEGKVAKLTRPARYRFTSPEPEQESLFRDDQDSHS